MSEVPRQERMIRAIAIGMAAGMLVGGAAMIVLSYRLLTGAPPCDESAGDDCTIEQQIAVDFAGYQSWFGLALVLLGAALGLYVWSIIRRERRAKEVAAP